MKKTTLFLLLFFVCFTAKSQYSKDVLLEPILKTDTTSIGQKIIFPPADSNEVSILKVTIPPGKSTGWHKHLFPVFAYVLKGTLTVEIKDKQPMIFNPNSSFSEVINTYHNGCNKGNSDVVLIAFFTGEKGKPLSVH